MFCLWPCATATATKDFAEARKTGRIDAYWVDVMGTQLMLVNIYGWTAGNQREENADKTDDLICIAMQEIDAWGKPPVIIGGDLNADTDKLPVLQEALDSGEYIDLGGSADMWGAERDQPTVQVSGNTKASRLDYLIASTRLMPSINGFRVDQCDKCPTHQPVQI